MEIAFLLFDELTTLDAVGPYEVLQHLPGARPRFVAKEPGPKRDACGALALVAAEGLDQVTRPDVLVVPGGPGTRSVVDDAEVLEWVRSVHLGSRWTTSVCTGSLILGAAGLLDGLEATTHWMELEALARTGARPRARRVVEQGKVMTAAGVSSGIDLALRLAQREAGDDIAQAIQLYIEYDPDPPFDSGSPAKAPGPVVELLRGARGSGADGG
ncbi:MAG: DJ-1/PfpI family protein [Actinomycetota bacterium]|nr:DJ-1/PfpI family protein [Actinomycetota bacterium]